MDEVDVELVEVVELVELDVLDVELVELVVLVVVVVVVVVVAMAGDSVMAVSLMPYRVVGAIWQRLTHGASTNGMVVPSEA